MYFERIGYIRCNGYKRYRGSETSSIRKNGIGTSVLGYENYRKGINVEVDFSLEIRMVETSLALDEVNVMATKNEAGQVQVLRLGGRRLIICKLRAWRI